MKSVDPQKFSDPYTRDFLTRFGAVCAATTATWRQLLFIVLLVAAAVIGYVRDIKIFFAVMTFVLCAAYSVAVLFRLLSVFWALWFTNEHRFTEDEVASLKDEELPVYTILVPMYKEPEVAGKIINAVTTLDYPQDKLDVKLLLEEDDQLTRDKVTEVMDKIPPCVEVIVCPAVPKGQPKTKPRACNWGLDRARGKFLVIYDAEDRPEKDQLKKAILAFKKLEEKGKMKVACLQAKLNYFNADQNSLTRFFTLEYTTWFDLFLPGLHAFRTPIPLGGTSNHFKMDVLKDAGGWDPFNVTEDCDLGIRLARTGYSTEVLDSTTWEEANSQVGNWIRQRSRWVKGYFQTHLVHSRESLLPWIFLSVAFAYLWDVTDPAGLIPDPSSSPMPFAPVYSPSSLETSVAAGMHWFSLGAAGLCGLVFFINFVRRIISWGKRLSAKKNQGEGKIAGSGNLPELGLWNALTFRLTVGGLSLMLLMNLVFWVLGGMYLFRKEIAEVMPAFTDKIYIGTIKDDGSEESLMEMIRDWELYHTRVKDDLYEGTTVWLVLKDYSLGRMERDEASWAIQAIDPWSLASQLFYPLAIGLFFANFVFIFLGLVACRKRNLWHLFPYALAVPIYWVLGSIAAWKGFIQLMHNPWYWEKTVHGLSGTPPTPPKGSGSSVLGTVSGADKS